MHLLIESNCGHMLINQRRTASNNPEGGPGVEAALFARYMR